jgi:hypothetical protein
MATSPKKSGRGERWWRDLIEQWRSAPTTTAIERLYEEFTWAHQTPTARPRPKSLPCRSGRSLYRTRPAGRGSMAGSHQCAPCPAYWPRRPGSYRQSCGRAPLINGFVLTHAYFGRISSCAVRGFHAPVIGKTLASACIRNADGLRVAGGSGWPLRHGAMCSTDLNVRNSPSPCSCCSQAGWSGMRSSSNF